jgi:ActD protein
MQTPLLPPPVYGLLAEFEHPHELVEAAEAARAAGYKRIDAYSPFPVEGLADAIGFRRNELPLIIFIGGLIGCIGGFGMQYYFNAVDYAINVGGRPLNSWPMFIPVTFELTVLCAALSAIVGLFALNRLPMPYHPVFNVPEFVHATRDRFYLAIEARDPKFDLAKTREFLSKLNPHDIYEVPP